MLRLAARCRFAALTTPKLALSQTTPKLALSQTPILQNQNKRPKGKRGGKIRTGRFAQQWQQYPSPRGHQGFKLMPGFHKFRRLNPDTDKNDIWETVKDPNAVTKFRQDRQGTPLTELEASMPRIPLSNWHNYSYHFHADTYHLIRTIGTLKNSEKYSQRETRGPTGYYEDMRICFHLLKVEELKRAHKTGSTALTPRQLVEKSVAVCGPPVFPFKQKLKRMSKYKQNTAYVIKTYGRYTTRGWVFRAMREAIFCFQKPRKHGMYPIVFANEILKSANAEGRAYEQKQRFINTAIKERHRLRKQF